MAPQYRAKIQSITAQAPATLSNLAVGFDLLGVAIKAPVDRVTLTRRQDSRLKIVTIQSPDSLPYAVTQNTATIALRSAMRDQKDRGGFDVAITKGIDCGSGMGGSAASSVAALVAYNGFLKKPLSKLALLQHAIKAELAVSGGLCIENPAAALWGGTVLCPNASTVLPLPTPTGIVLAIKPKIEVRTQEARQLLPNNISLQACTTRTGRCASWVHAVSQKQWDLAVSMMEDDIVEPARAALWPHYQPIKKAALQAGAMAVCMSGSGPTVMCWLHKKRVVAVRRQVVACCDMLGMPVQSWVSSWRSSGALVIGEQ